MSETGLVFALAGVVLMVLGAHAAILQAQVLRKIIAVNVMGVGVFLILIATAYRGITTAADPVPHALVLTGIVVAVSATALALALERRRRNGVRKDD
jgi:multicomponent Na+:H+ antiporter subunit C